MNEKYRIDIADDPEYEDLIAEIYYESQFVAMLTQEGGFEHLRILIYSDPTLKNHWDFSFNEFQMAINHAKNRLWDLRKISEGS